MSGERDPAALSPGSRSSVATDRPVLLEVVDLSKSYGPVRAVRELSLDVTGRRGARDLRAQRRRQEHAREGARRPRQARRRRDPLRRAGALAPQPARRTGARDRAREPGAEPGPRAQRRGQHLPRGPRRPARSTGGAASRERARSVLDQLGLRHVPARDRGRDPLDRRAAARGDRPAARPRRAPAHPGRADRDAQQAGDRARVQGDARPRRAGPKRHLRLAPARRGVRALRSRDGAARRRCASGRTRSTRSTGAR